MELCIALTKLFGMKCNFNLYIGLDLGLWHLNNAILFSVDTIFALNLTSSKSGCLILL